MTINIKITDTISSISENINQAIAEEFNKRIKKNKKKAIDRMRRTLPVWIRVQPEMRSLLDVGTPGSLNANFGLPVGLATNAVDALINSIVNTINIRLTPMDRSLKGNVEFVVQPQNYANLLSLPEGYNPLTSSNIHWLDWLLLKGDTTIIIGYSYNPKSGLGRSGGGNMRAGGVWRVPPEFAGSDQNNFLTRALSNRERELSILLKDMLEV